MSLHFQRMFPYKLQVFWPNGFRKKRVLIFFSVEKLNRNVILCKYSTICIKKNPAITNYYDNIKSALHDSVVAMVKYIEVDERFIQS